MAVLEHRDHPAEVSWRPIRLRSVFRPFSSRIDVGTGTIELWLPAYFGRRRPFAVPIATVGVVDPSATASTDTGTVLETAGLTIPYLTASGELGGPNLLLVFAEPQRVPSIGWRGWMGLPGLPVREVNRPEGWYIDGVALQVRGGVERAVAALSSVGVEVVASLHSWTARTRPGRVSAEAVASRRRAAEEAVTAHLAIEPAVARGALFGMAGVFLGAAVWSAVAVFLHVQAFLVAIGAGILIAWLVLLGGRRLVPVLQVVVVVEVMTTVVLGELTTVLMLAWQAGDPLSVPAAAALVWQDLGHLGLDPTFAILGGIVGAATGLGWARQRDGAPSAGVPGTHPLLRRGGQVVVAGAILGGLFLSVADEDTIGDGNVGTDEAAGRLVNELRIGECFDEPAGAVFETVEVVPCPEPHDVELFHRFDVPLDAASGFPGDEVMVEHIEGCFPAFEGFVGRDYGTSTLDVYGIWPTADAWADGDREMLCGAITMDGTKLEGSVRGSRR